MRWRHVAISILTCCVLPVAVSGRSGIAEDTKRPITVPDVIQMTVFGNLGYLGGISFKHNVAQFSPDGKRFFIVLRKGNLEKNTNDYSILLFRSEEAIQSKSPVILASLSSSSNRPAIKDVVWLDNRSIVFLGENPHETQQLYRVDCDSKELRKLTDHPTNLLSYALTPDGSDGSTLVFAAERPMESLFNVKAGRDGIVVQEHLLEDLMSGQNRMQSVWFADLFTEKLGTHVKVPIKATNVPSWSPLRLSPNGRYLIVETVVNKIPERWRDFKDRNLQMELRENDSNRAVRFVYQYELFDLESGQSKPVFDAPIGQGTSDVAWSQDNRSFVVCGTYLPLDVRNSSERKERQTHRFVAEVMIPNLEVQPIAQRELRLLKWDWPKAMLLFQTTARESTVDVGVRVVAYQREKSVWQEVEANTTEQAENDPIEVSLEEDMNTPPMIFVEERNTGRRNLLMDLNPQFQGLKFGSVESVVFKATDGRDVKGGLYFPPDYMAGKKYPVVIQTHGWNPERFWIDGPYSTAFAAQPLAGRGFIVAQLEEDLTFISTPKEVEEETAAYEGVIDYLDGRKLIDRERVGIIGFSRTGLSVKYALTRSHYHFSAAAVADPTDSGYFRYLAFLNFAPAMATDPEGLNGGMPFGEGLASWLKSSTGFRLAEVMTPVRLEANDLSSMLGQWEWFAGLRRLRKPVELILIPDGDHVLVKPWERMISQQGNVDWFCFWLKGEEDPDPAKAQQYSRWRELRKLDGAMARRDASGR